LLFDSNSWINSKGKSQKGGKKKAGIAIATKGLFSSLSMKVLAESLRIISAKISTELSLSKYQILSSTPKS